MILKEAIKRGFRFSNPYRGTVLEIVDDIPDSAGVPHSGAPVPGVLVYYDFLDPNDPEYATREVLPLQPIIGMKADVDGQVAGKEPWQAFVSWVPLDQFMKWDTGL